MNPKLALPLVSHQKMKTLPLRLIYYRLFMHENTRLQVVKYFHMD